MRPPLNITNNPASLYQLSFIQLLQSFTFYGIRSLLVLYFTQGMFFSDSQALTLYGNTMAFLYLAPLIGGLLIDKYWSSTFNLRIGVTITCLGTLLISLPYGQTFLYGLVVLIVGQGLFKPTIPYLIDQLYVGKDQNRSSGYTFYYVMINVGSALAPFLCGILKQIYGWQISFTACLFSALIGLFFAFRYTSDTFSLSLNWLKIILFSAGGLASSVFIYYFLNFPQWMDYLILYLTPLVGIYLGYLYISSENKKNTLLMFLVIFLFCLFAALFEQAGGSVTLFIEKHINRSIGGFENLPSSLFLGLNPLFTITIGFLLSRLLNLSVNLSPLKQLAIGFAVIAIGFSVLWLSTFFVTESTSPGVWWIVGAFLFHALGELCIVPITLSLATKFAPQQKKGIVIGLWYLAAAYGHYLAVWLSKSIFLKASSSSSAPVSSVENFTQVFAITTEIAFACAMVLLILSFWHGKTFSYMSSK
ncbi:peptide MFS transporter [Candidatus Paracaedibacter symbiosus]|uniref:peptide MFS transporter n=1 Tax=Candidatus Paracaedibacter symbiosus TaxID=244582 RepID=UPI000509A882|nr:oligopeptide:H+ symporter [Candidatus Paracaedibacter symbiosus]